MSTAMHTDRRLSERMYRCVYVFVWEREMKTEIRYSRAKIHQNTVCTNSALFRQSVVARLVFVIFLVAAWCMKHNLVGIDVEINEVNVLSGRLLKMKEPHKNLWLRSRICAVDYYWNYVHFRRGKFLYIIWLISRNDNHRKHWRKKTYSSGGMSATTKIDCSRCIH